MQEVRSIHSCSMRDAEHGTTLQILTRVVDNAIVAESRRCDRSKSILIDDNVKSLWKRGQKEQI
eukprot:2066383-Amphidinium_carterae.1